MPRGTEGRTKVNGRPRRREDEGPFEVCQVTGREWMTSAKLVNDRWQDGWELARVFAVGVNDYSLLWRRREESKSAEMAAQ